MAFNNDTHLEDKFLEIKQTWDIKTVIETGTYYADTTKWLAKNFDQVYTCEIHEPTYAIAVEQLEGITNVYHELKPSQQFLGEALAKAEGQVLVFLDAHWFENPLLKEIEIIGESGKRPVLVIHDFKVPGKSFGYDEYPGIVYDWNYVKDAVAKAYDDKYWHEYNERATGAKRGCLFVYPK